jgi:putative transposase
VGIDLGIKNLATISYFYNDCNGNDCGYYKNINHDNYMKRLERKSIHYQRVMSRKRRVNNCYKVECDDGKYRRYDSNNYKKVRELHQRVEARIANIRLNYIHHITRDIINLKPEVITMEDLKVSNMLKNPKLAPHISKACWRMFRDIMTYKATMYGIKVQIAPWWFPSSKNCSCCGHKKRKLGLDERVYRCKECGLEIDRDLNAAINLQWFNYDRT